VKELIKEYAEQDNRCTAYPIYVTVQELVFVGVIDDSRAGRGDGETVYEWYHPDYEGSFDTKGEFVARVREHYGEDSKKIKQTIREAEELQCFYLYQDVEFFLTIKGAKEYIDANRHNLKSPRTYVKHFSNKNYEMRRLLKEMGFKTKDYE